MRKPVSSRWRTFAATTCAAMCATTGACASAAFAVHAGRAKAGGGEQIGHSLADPVLGDQLLDVEIDRGRSQARTVLHVRRHRVWERLLRHAAAMVAAVDRGAVLGALQAWLWQVEHLTPFHAHHHRRGQAGLAVPARGCGVALNAVRLVHRTQGVPLVPDLPTAGLSRPTAQAFKHPWRLFQAVARWWLAAVGAVLVQPAAQIGDLLLQRGIFLADGGVFLTERGVVCAQAVDITSQRVNQFRQGRGRVHASLDSRPDQTRQRNQRAPEKNALPVALRTHRRPLWGGWELLYFRLFRNLLSL